MTCTTYLTIYLYEVISVASFSLCDLRLFVIKRTYSLEGIRVQGEEAPGRGFSRSGPVPLVVWAWDLLLFYTLSLSRSIHPLSRLARLFGTRSVRGCSIHPLCCLTRPPTAPVSSSLEFRGQRISSSLTCQYSTCHRPDPPVVSGVILASSLSAIVVPLSILVKISGSSERRMGGVHAPQAVR